jgi:hypothetical protein
MRTAIWASMVLLLAGCGNDGRKRDLPDDGAVADAAPPEHDMAVSPDAAPPDAAPADAAPPDALVADAAPPDAAPPPPEVCNGEDDDGDGQVDEGVANICGGCGGLPPEGCQSWRVQLLRDEAGQVDTDRVVGLAAGIVSTSERRIDGGDCQVVRSPAQHPDAHLGLVNVDAPGATLNQVPTYDERAGASRYANNPTLGRIHLFDDGDVLGVRAGGGRLVGPFRAEIAAPAALAGVTGDDLAVLTSAARGEQDGATIHWMPADPARAGELVLFVGGSVPVFSRNVYRGIQHYELDGVLQDDGELTLPAGFFPPVPQSSIWAYLERQRRVERPQGPHGVEIVAGQRVEHRVSGALDGDAPAPFDILAPSPDDRHVMPGQPLEVRWSALPPGVGPLTVTLTLVDSTNLESRQITCTADDPSTGRLVLPGDFTQPWPAGAGDLRQLTVTWNTAASELQAPDSGKLTESLSLLLRLEP